MTKFHTKNVSSAKALGRIRVRPEKVAEFIHRLRKKRRQKNPDQNTVTSKKATSNFMHN